MQPQADSAPVAEQPQSLISIDPMTLDRAITLAIPDLLKVFGSLVEQSQRLVSIDPATLDTTASAIPDLLKVLSTLIEQSQRMRSIHPTTLDKAEQPKKEIPDNSAIPDLLNILSTFIEKSQRFISIDQATLDKANVKGNLTEQPKKGIPDNSAILDLQAVSEGPIEHHQELFSMDLSTTKSSLSEQLQRLVLLLQANLAFSSLDNCSQANVSDLKMVHTTQQRKYYHSGIIPTACYNTSRRVVFRRFVHSC